MSKIWFCPTCGYEIESKGRCHSCRQKLIESPLPSLEAGAEEDEVGYRIEDWEDRARGRLIEALVAERIPHRFEDGELVVGAEDEERVDQLLVDAVPEGGDDSPGVPAPDDEDSEYFAEVALSVQSLYAAAGRLRIDPTDMEADGEVAEASAGVFMADEFGTADADTWAAVGRVTRRLLAALGSDDALDEEIRRQAGVLVTMLRPIVAPFEEEAVTGAGRVGAPAQTNGSEAPRDKPSVRPAGESDSRLSQSATETTDDPLRLGEGDHEEGDHEVGDHEVGGATAGLDEGAHRGGGRFGGAVASGHLTDAPVVGGDAVPADGVPGDAVQGDAMQGGAMQSEAARSGEVHVEDAHVAAAHVPAAQADEVQGEDVRRDGVEGGAAPGAHAKGHGVGSADRVLGGGPETSYEAPEWLPEQRAMLTVLLEERSIVHVWDGTDLVVPSKDEASVEELFDQIGGVSADDDDETRYRALEELFAAVDRLANDPADEARGASVVAAAGAVEGPTPLGFDDGQWLALRRRVRTLADAIEHNAHPDVVSSQAVTLRDTLRQLV